MDAISSLAGCFLFSYGLLNVGHQGLRCLNDNSLEMKRIVLELLYKCGFQGALIEFPLLAVQQ